MKQRIIIRARSINIGQSSDAQHQIPVSDKSIFSDGYDFDQEKVRLNELLKSGQSVEQNHPEHQAVADFLYHQTALQHHIYKNHTNPRFRRRHRPESIRIDDYEIFTSQDENFKALGRLTDTAEDSVQLHTKQAVRLWMGSGSTRNPYQRWPGIRYAMGLSREMINHAQNDHPFAHAELIKFESQLYEVLDYLQSENEELKKKLDQTAVSGININISGTPNPTEIPVGPVRGYGFKLLQLLTAFDMYVRLTKTLAIKGLIKNRDGNDNINEAGRRYRVMAQNLYNATMNIRSIDWIKRSLFLNGNDEMGSNLKTAVETGMLERLPADVLNYERLPEFAYISSPYKPEQISQIMAFAEKFGLTAVEDGLEESVTA